MQRVLSITLIFALTLLSIFPSTTPVFAEETEDDVYADGEYDLPFVVWKDNADSKSVADDYFAKPAKLIVDNGEYTVRATLTNSSWWQYLKVQSGDDYVDVTEVSRDDKENTRVVEFMVADLEQSLNAKVHIIVTGIPGLNYDNKYDIRLKFDPSGIPAASPDVADNGNAKEADTSNDVQTPDEGTGSGDEQQESGGNGENPGKDESSVEKNGGNDQDPGKDDGSAEGNGGGEQDLGKADSAEDNENDEKTGTITLADGNYTIDLNALYATEDKPSGMARYIDPTAFLSVKGGKTYLTLTLTDHKTVTGFQVEGKEPLKEEVNETANTRDVTYDLDQLTTMMNAQVQYTVGAHSGDQPLRLQFNKDSVVLIDQDIEEDEKNEDTDHLKYADGVYTLPFVVWQAVGDEQSVADGYFEKPAKLIVDNGKYTVQAQLKNSSWWQHFKVQSGNDFVDVTEVSKDEEKDTIVVEFKVADLDQILNAKVHVNVPFINYDNKYGIRFKFDPSKMTPKEDEEEPKSEIIELEEGTYAIDFAALHADEDKASGMAKYLDKTAFVTVKNGKTLLTLTISDHKTVTGFQVEGNQPIKEVPNETANTRAVTYDFDQLTSVMNARVQYTVGSHNGDQPLRLAFNKDSLTKVVIEDPEDKPRDALEEGKVYSVDFKIEGIDDETKEVIKKHIKKDATVSVNNGLREVRLTVENQSNVDSFQYEVNGKFIDAKTIEVDEKADTKIIALTVDELTSNVKVKMTILNSSPSQFVRLLTFNLLKNSETSEYEFNLAFDVENAQVVEKVPEEPKPEVIELSDGNYTIGLEALHATEDKSSGMARYIGSTASLSVKAGKTYLTLTLTDHKTVTGFQVESKQPEKEEVNETANTRDVTYGINQLTTLMNAQVQYTVGSHSGDQPLRLQFNKESLTLIEQEDTEQTKYKDGVYTLPFEVWQDRTDEKSVADDYFEKPATVKIEKGKYTVQATLKNSSWWKSLQTESGNTFKEVKTVSENKTDDTRLVQFSAEDLDKILNGKVRIIVKGIPGFEYDNKYDIRFKFHTNQMELAKNDDPGFVDDNIEPDGDHDNGNNENNGNNGNNSNNGNNNNGQQDIDPKNLEDGEYSIEYKVLKSSTNETSVMNDYVVSPGHLKVKDGKKFLAITLKNSSWITDFKVDQKGKLAAPAVLSADAKDDTRVVEFEVDDLFKKLDGWVKVDFDISGLSYHNDYDVQFAFDPSSIKLLKAGETYPEQGEVEETKPTHNGETKPTQNTENDKGVPAFDRNGDNDNKNNDGSTNKLGMNPKTADKAKIILFTSLLIGSLIALIIKRRRKLSTNN